MSFSSPFPQVHVPTTSLYDYLFADLDDADAERLVTDLVAARTVAAAGAAPSASDPRSPECRANPS